jgi:hypothetical protein
VEETVVEPEVVISGSIFFGGGGNFSIDAFQAVVFPSVFPLIGAPDQRERTINKEPFL